MSQRCISLRSMHPTGICSLSDRLSRPGCCSSLPTPEASGGGWVSETAEGPGTRDAPREFGQRLAALPVDRRNANPASPAVVSRQPRDSGFFHQPNPLRHRRAGHGCSAMVLATLAYRPCRGRTGSSAKGSAYSRIDRDHMSLSGTIAKALHARLHRPRAVEQRARLPSRKIDERSIARGCGCRIETTEIMPVIPRSALRLFASAFKTRSQNRPILAVNE
jgi:hypothetical protein